MYNNLKVKVMTTLINTGVTLQTLKNNSQIKAQVHDIKANYEMGFISATGAMSQMYELINNINSDIYFATDFVDVEKLSAVALNIMIAELTK